jgi:hypothetical protein
VRTQVFVGAGRLSEAGEIYEIFMIKFLSVKIFLISQLCFIELTNSEIFSESVSRIDFYSLLPWVPLCRYVFQV